MVELELLARQQGGHNTTYPSTRVNEQTLRRAALEEAAGSDHGGDYAMPRAEARQRAQIQEASLEAQRDLSAVAYRNDVLSSVLELLLADSKRLDESVKSAQQSLLRLVGAATGYAAPNRPGV